MAKFYAILGIVFALTMPTTTWGEAMPQGSAAAQPAAGGNHTQVTGFRGAKWGMSESEVKAVIAADFKISADKVKSEQNPNERTTVLTVTVPDLLDGAGPARVSYIL